MTSGQLDVLDSIITLGKADIAKLADDTGRHVTGVRNTVRRLTELGYAKGTGKEKGPSQPGRAAEVFEVTAAGRKEWWRLSS